MNRIKKKSKDILNNFHSSVLTLNPLTIRSFHCSHWFTEGQPIGKRKYRDEQKTLFTSCKWWKESLALRPASEAYTEPYQYRDEAFNVQSCKLYNKKYMITLTKITSTDIFAFIAVLVFKLLSRKFLFINRKENSNC